MSLNTQLPKELVKPIRACNALTITESVNACQFYSFQDYTPKEKKLPEGYVSLDSLVKDWESTDAGRSALEDGRRWVAESFYEEESETLKALRLKMGWSQTKLASALGTSQSHVARIERGTENVAIETCRKICRALDIDMNTLDMALKAQEAIFNSRNR